MGKSPREDRHNARAATGHGIPEMVCSYQLIRKKGSLSFSRALRENSVLPAPGLCASGPQNCEAHVCGCKPATP